MRERCSLHGDDFIFQHDAAPADSVKLTQAWLSANCRDFINKDSCPPNSPDLNPLDFHLWGAMLLAYNKVNPSHTTLLNCKRY